MIATDCDAAIKTLPIGVTLRPLKTHRDDRGSFTEIFRQAWPVNIDPIQWNYVNSNANVLRGFHVHKKHSDYLLLLRGKMHLALRDLRRDSPTENLALMLEFNEDALSGICIPPGVGHAFYFPEPSMHIYSVSEYWDTADELACHWSDPSLEIDWPEVSSPLLSPRDKVAGSLEEMIEALHS